MACICPQEWQTQAQGSDADQQNLIQRLSRELLNERTAGERARTELEDVNSKVCRAWMLRRC